jgi:hypothetical protein
MTTMWGEQPCVRSMGFFLWRHLELGAVQPGERSRETRYRSMREILPCA